MNTTDTAIVNDAFLTFKQGIEQEWGHTVTNEAALRQVFLDSLVDLVRAAVEEYAACGCEIDEIYGDAVLDCIEIEEDEE